ncbi:hypothetical protein N7493_011489 [Penicillium malachiteum]|uniref:Arylamine N-acetyltransferase n=1 Tax=Penicillium malachiteum TaxID=1324776 RepID=A0AAD6MQD2_9EURO|nr:hypothetical protein N7493_011489 [Penicillium malachiteum]
MSSPHPIYTEAQLEKYLQRINHPSHNHGSSLEEVREKIQTDALGTLAELQRLHLAAIPWGNSGLHYSNHHTISLDPEMIFQKMVERRLDGYCMETTGLLFNVLLCLGYRVYATGGRVSRAVATGVDDGQFKSFGHMVLIVAIGDLKYMVDVGFGANCATAPLPLQDGATATRIAPSDMRLVRQSLTASFDKEQKVWVYQSRHNPESNWLPCICFSEVEFLPQDFELMNFGTSQQRTSWFTQTFVCTRMILDPSGQEVIGQDVMVGKQIKRRIHSNTEILEELQNEEDRVRALALHFDMHLRQEEILGIRGLSSELK